MLLGYELPWEDISQPYPSSFAHPAEVIIEGSNGASDYGNKFGEPVIAGFARSFGLRLGDGERREWIKPIMFSGGLGSIENSQLTKREPEKGTFLFVRVSCNLDGSDGVLKIERAFGRRRRTACLYRHQR